MDAAKRQRLLDQIQTVRATLTNYDAEATREFAETFAEIDVLESMIDDRDWTPAPEVDWTAQC